MTTHLVTGASGQLGQLTIAHLATLVDPASIIALVRSDEAAARFAAQGIQTRRGDYKDSTSLAAAFAGVDRVLLISSSEMENRVAQHQAAIDAAKAAGVAFLAYTSVLRAPENPMILARDHAATEAHLRASGLPHTLLRNGWYIENYLGSAAQALASGQLFGAAGTGRIAAAARDDYALAAAQVLRAGMMAPCWNWQAMTASRWLTWPARCPTWPASRSLSSTCPKQPWSRADPGRIARTRGHDPGRRRCAVGRRRGV
jgi:NAD(P)H dehydrogenase (quinone)